MPVARLISLAAATMLLGQPAYSQQFDSRLRGNWTLDIAQSTFGPDGPPVAGTVRWSEHGWVVALVFGNGYVYADAVITDSGCRLIGVSSDYSCTFLVLAPKHVRFTLKERGITRRVGDITLVDANTTRTVHRVTPASDSPYTETTIWVRDPRK